MKRVSILIAVVVILSMPSLLPAWEWYEDQTLLNPTQFPDFLSPWMIWTAGDLGEGIGVSWIIKQQNSLFRLTPLRDLDTITEWEIDYEYFDGIEVPANLTQIVVDDWAFDAGMNEILLLDSHGIYDCFRNQGTPSEPDWVSIGNPFGGTIMPDPPFSVQLCNLDNDRSLDALFMYDQYLRQFERVGYHWEVRDTLHTMDFDHWPHAICCADLDGDDDTDVILKADRPCMYFSYEIIENVGTPEEPDFGPYHSLPTWMAMPYIADLNGDTRLDLLFYNAVMYKTDQVGLDFEQPLFFIWDKKIGFVGEGYGGSNPPWAFFHDYYQSPSPQRTFQSGIFTDNGLQITHWAGDVIGADTSSWGDNHPSCYFDDLDGDDDNDFVLLTFQRTLRQLRNDGTTNNPIWEETDDLFPFELPEGTSEFKIIDIDGDGLIDVMTGTPYQLFEGVETDIPPYIEWELNEEWTENLPAFNMVMGDPDGDGDADLFGYHSSETVFYHNVGSPANPQWELESEAIEGFEYNRGAFTFIDFNGDGKDDIQIGSTIYYSLTSSNVDPPVEIPGQFSLSVYPNPFNSTAMITFDLQTDANITVSVFDILGREILDPIHVSATAGNLQVPLNCSNLSSGAYIVNAESGQFSVSKRIFLLK